MMAEGIEDGWGLGIDENTRAWDRRKHTSVEPALATTCKWRASVSVTDEVLAWDEGLKATGEWGEVDVPSGATLFYEIELVSIQNGVAAGDYWVSK